jgi:hypothetical protein
MSTDTSTRTTLLSYGTKPQLRYRRDAAMTSGRAPTPQWKKLGLKPGHRLLLDHRPEGWALLDRPEELGVEVVTELQPVDTVISFVGAAAELAPRLPALGAAVRPAGSVWIAWPRRAAGHTSDVTDNGVRAAALPLGLVDVKVAALDEDWSALKLVWRVENR